MDNEVRRIFLKYIVLKIINEKPTYGYEIIKTIELRSNGSWKPSAGSVYPILEGLELKGFIRSEEVDRKKVYTITPGGVVALDRMTQKKIELLNEMSLLINSITECNENDYSAGIADNIRNVGAQSESMDYEDSTNFEKINERR